MEYLKTVITSNQQNGLLLRLSSHLALFYRAASFQLKVTCIQPMFTSFLAVLNPASYIMFNFSVFILNY